MSRSAIPLPWYRVVRSDRTLAFEVGSEPYNKQRDLLEREGVQIVNGKVVVVETDETVDLDMLLWGLPDTQTYMVPFRCRVEAFMRDNRAQAPFENGA